MSLSSVCDASPRQRVVEKVLGRRVPYPQAGREPNVLAGVAVAEAGALDLRSSRRDIEGMAGCVAAVTGRVAGMVGAAGRVAGMAGATLDSTG